MSSRNKREWLIYHSLNISCADPAKSNHPIDTPTTTPNAAKRRKAFICYPFYFYNVFTLYIHYRRDSLLIKEMVFHLSINSIETKTLFTGWKSKGSGKVPVQYCHADLRSQRL